MTALPSEPPEFESPQPGEPAALEFDFLELNRTIAKLSTDVPLRLDEDRTAEAAVLLLHDLRAARMLLAQIEDYAQIEAVKRLRYGRNEVAGFVAEVRGGKNRTEWRNDDVAWQIVAEFTVDTDGVTDPAAAGLVGKVRDRFMNCMRPAWRTGALREVGVDPDIYCHSEPGKKRVEVTPAVKEDVA